MEWSLELNFKYYRLSAGSQNQQEGRQRARGGGTRHLPASTEVLFYSFSNLNNCADAYQLRTITSVRFESEVVAQGPTSKALSDK